MGFVSAVGSGRGSGFGDVFWAGSGYGSGSAGDRTHPRPDKAESGCGKESGKRSGGDGAEAGYESLGGACPVRGENQNASGGGGARVESVIGNVTGTGTDACDEVGSVLVVYGNATGRHGEATGSGEECGNANASSGQKRQRESDAYDGEENEGEESEEDLLQRAERCVSTYTRHNNSGSRTPPLPPQPESLGLSKRSSKPPLPPLPLPLPRPRPPPRASLSLVRISSSLARRSLSSMARESPALAWRISSFFSSTNVRGTPAGES